MKCHTEPYRTRFSLFTFRFDSTQDLGLKLLAIFTAGLCCCAALFVLDISIHRLIDSRVDPRFSTSIYLFVVPSTHSAKPTP